MTTTTARRSFTSKSGKHLRYVEVIDSTPDGAGTILVRTINVGSTRYGNLSGLEWRAAADRIR